MSNPSDPRELANQINTSIQGALEPHQLQLVDRFLAVLDDDATTEEQWLGVVKLVGHLSGVMFAFLGGPRKDPRAALEFTLAVFSRFGSHPRTVAALESGQTGKWESGEVRL